MGQFQRISLCEDESSIKIAYKVLKPGGLPDVYVCSKCRHMYRHFKGDLDQYHTEEYRKNFPTFALEKRIFHIENLLDSIQWIQYYISGYTFLEIGSGDGLFAEKFCEKFKIEKKDYTCCEINPNLAAQTAEMGFSVANDSFLAVENVKADVVIALDVLEHIDDVFSFAEKVSDVCKEMLIVQVPVKRSTCNPNPVPGYDDIPPFDGHVHYFSSVSAVKLFDDNFKPQFTNITEKNDVANGPEIQLILKKRAEKKKVVPKHKIRFLDVR